MQATIALDRNETTSTSTPVLRAVGLRVAYGYGHSHREVVAADDVSLEIRRGERVALVGESGSGKTATCLALAGFLSRDVARVTYDELEFDGRAIDREAVSRLPRRTPGIAMVFQDAMTSLDPVWTIGSQLGAVLKAGGGLSRRQRASEAESWLRRVGLNDTERVLRARPYELSGGMRQRVMLAIALCGEPKLLIADEPTSALDASLARDVMELLVGLTTELGTALLVVSHDIQLCSEYSNRTVVMYNGRVVEEATSAELISAAHPYTAGLLRSIPTLAGASLDVLPTIPPAPVLEPGEAQLSGCGFRARCTEAEDRCSVVPPLVTVGAAHRARCWHAEARLEAELVGSLSAAGREARQ
jgi:peptide/nickel transport system ATP-binding protein